MEYKCKEGMIDNRMVKDHHQQGIKRVMQRKHERNSSTEGHHGKMGMGDKAEWSRKGDSLTPRKA
jgi:hypothetical protein